MKNTAAGISTVSLEADKAGGKPFLPCSFLDVKLQVTCQQYAVSYVKKSYASAGSLAETYGKEHTFILIQKPNSIYRAEITMRVRDSLVEEINGKMSEVRLQKPIIDYIIIDKKICFDNEQTFQEAQNLIIWHKNIKHPEEHLYHYTWLISAEKAEELEAAIKKEMGSEKKDEKAVISYSQFGNKSIFRSGDPVEAVKIISKPALAYPTFYYSYGIISNAIVPAFRRFNGWYNIYYGQKYGLPIHPYINSLNNFAVESSGIIWGAMAGIFMATTVLATTELLFPVKKLPEAHNCASWATEKLQNLNIPEVTKDLAVKPIVEMADTIAHVSSFHIADISESTKALAALTIEPSIVGSVVCIGGTAARYTIGNSCNIF